MSFKTVSTFLFCVKSSEPVRQCLTGGYQSRLTCIPYIQQHTLILSLGIADLPPDLTADYIVRSTLIDRWGQLLDTNDSPVCKTDGNQV